MGAWVAGAWAAGAWAAGGWAPPLLAPFLGGSWGRLGRLSGGSFWLEDVVEDVGRRRKITNVFWKTSNFQKGN